MAEVRITARIMPPMTPNFFRMDDGQVLPIEAVTDAGLREVGRLWTKDLLLKARNRRKKAPP